MSAVTAERRKVSSSQATESSETRARIDPNRTVWGTGEHRDAVWVAVVGGSEDVVDGGAKKLATKYAFDGRPDAAVDRVIGPTRDDGTVPPPSDMAEGPSSGTVMTADQYRQMAAAGQLRRGAKTFVAYHLVRPLTS